MYRHINNITNVTDELHDDVNELWEELVDKNYKDVEVIIAKTITKLKHIKSNLKNTSEI
jgi:hypothetical protein